MTRARVSQRLALVALVWAMGFGPASSSASAGEAAASKSAEGSAPGQGSEKGGAGEAANYILHHVSDSREVEFDLPLVRREGIHFEFPVWRIPLKGDACPADVESPALLSRGCLDITLSKNVFMLLLSSTLLLLVVIFGSHRDRTQLVPRGGLANFIELLVLFVRNDIAIKNIGETEGPRYTPYLLSVFFFILAANLLGLFPWMSTATGNIAVTAALALCTFVVTQVASIRSAGVGGFLKHLTGGVHWALWPLMIPVEILGLFTKPFALCIRLFANMLAGHLVLFFLLGLIFFLNHPAVASLAVPFAVGVYLLELFVAFVQAYIFAMLSAVFIGLGVAMGHHGHDAHGLDSEDAGGHGHAERHDHAPASPGGAPGAAAH